MYGVLGELIPAGRHCESSSAYALLFDTPNANAATMRATQPVTSGIPSEFLHISCNVVRKWCWWAG